MPRVKQKAHLKAAVRNKLLQAFELSLMVTFLQGQFLPLDKLQTSPIAPTKTTLANPFELVSKDVALENQISIIATNPDLHPGVFVVNPDTGKYASFHGYDQFSAASLIKFPIFVALLSCFDSGEIKPTEKLLLRCDLKTGGSGFLQWRPVGSPITVEETSQLMMIFSDNTATNLIIDRLGGRQKLNRQFVDWGLTHTQINNWLADLAGTNTTSPSDLALLMGRIYKGQILSAKSRAFLLNVMQRTRVRTLLPPGLPPHTVIAHKTGDIASMVGDAGLVTTDNGTKYIVAVQVTRKRNDHHANLLIQNISKLIYDDFK